MKEASECTASAAPDEAQVVELGDALADDARGVLELGAEVLIVAGHQRDARAVRHRVQHEHAERHRQRLVRAPVRRQRRAEDARRPGAHQTHGRRAAHRRHAAELLAHVGRQQAFGAQVLERHHRRRVLRAAASVRRHRERTRGHRQWAWR